MQPLYLTGAGREGGDWRDVQNLQFIHVPVQYDGGSVHISGPGRRVHLREIVIDELADDRSFAHSGSADDSDAQRLHHSWSPSSAPWTAATGAGATIRTRSWNSNQPHSFEPAAAKSTSLRRGEETEQSIHLSPSVG